MQHEAGRANAWEMTDAEIAVEEARIVLLQFRAELEALRSSKDDKDD